METTAALVPVVSVANPNLTPGTTKKEHKKAQVGSKTAQKVVQDRSHRAQGGPICQKWQLSWHPHGPKDSDINYVTVLAVVKTTRNYSNWPFGSQDVPTFGPNFQH